MRRFALSFAALFLAVGFAAAVESGPAAGTSVGPFHVMDVTGRHAGQSHCYRCEYGSRPVVAIFARSMNDKVVKAVKDLNGKIAGNKEYRAFVVLLSEDSSAATTSLKEVATKNEIKAVPLTVFENLAGPSGYEISKDAEVTVVMWRGGKVVKSVGFEAGKFCDKCTGAEVAAFMAPKKEKEGN